MKRTEKRTLECPAARADFILGEIGRVLLATSYFAISQLITLHGSSSSVALQKDGIR
jgi:hypothetical protein